MRFMNLIRGDMRFQAKYGFYTIYVIFTILYVAVLFALPREWRRDAAAIMIMTDPATLGLMFMGAIVLFEKSQRVMDSLTVSPVRPREYVLSKTASLGAISLVVGFVIALLGGERFNALYLAAGLALGSGFFTLVALQIALKSKTLNQFMLFTVPVEVLCIVPSVAYLLGYTPAWLRFHPCVMMAELIRGDLTYGTAAVITGVLIVLDLLLAAMATRALTKAQRGMGGIKL